MFDFVLIEQPTLRQLVPLGDERTDLYQSGNLGMRWMFWRRLFLLSKLIQRSGVKGSCLDFGGGTGMMLPTLSRLFVRVDCVDLDAHLARKVIQHYSLSNVSVLEMDVNSPAFGQYNAIVAADVLEHFQDLDMPIEAIKRNLAKDGWLFTSCPTENWLYRALRVVFRKKKPVDHYQSAYEVEGQLRHHGFIRKLHFALPVPLLPLFLISGWKYQG